MRLSTAETAVFKVNLEENDVGALVAAVVAAAEPAAHANGNRIEVEAAADIGFVVCDAAKLDECLRHLLFNAAKFTQDGVISVRTTLIEAGGAMTLQIEIADTGLGIAEAELPNLFRPFARTESSVARPPQGPGLGLAVTQRLARLMGGDVTVSSVVTQGSRFVLAIPVAPSLSFDERAAAAHSA